MNILLTAATDAELHGLHVRLNETAHSVRLASHGVGLMTGTFHLLDLCHSRPDLILQLGIAGTYQSAISRGDTVVVASETMGDAGAEDHDDLLSLFDLGLQAANTFPFRDGKLLNPHTHLFPTHLKQVKGLTVNLAAGTNNTIDRRRKKFNPDIETMEGAVLHYVGLMKQIPFIQFRGISNIVEPRNRASWQIREALDSCHREVVHFINQLA